MGSNNNGCPVCGGIGRVLAFGMAGDPVIVACPECAGLSFTPACVDDYLARRPDQHDSSQ